MTQIAIIAIDPGNKTGITFGSPFVGPDHWRKEAYDFTPKSATKTRAKEPDYYRYGHLCNKLEDIVKELLEYGYSKLYLVCEDAEGFMRGKSAVKVSHSYRGAIKAFCYQRNIEYIEIQPNDLKFFVTGKRSAEKTEMIEFAKNKYGYIGHDDNVADSMHLFAYGIEWINKNYPKECQTKNHI